MKSKGNGTPQQCVANLLNLFQFEVPYARLKGMPTDIIDAPKDDAIYKIKNYTTWLIERYEPRVNVDSVDIDFDDNGKLTAIPNITINGA